MIALFLAQVFAGAWAAMVFRMGLEQRVAGVLAGSVFVLVGLYGGVVGYRWRGLSNHQPWTRYLCIGMSIGHLAAFALPMLSYRIIHWEEPFSKIEFWGLTGPEFHAVSTRYYSIWLIVTLMVVVVEQLRKRKVAR